MLHFGETSDYFNNYKIFKYKTAAAYLAHYCCSHVQNNGFQITLLILTFKETNDILAKHRIN